MFRDAVLDLAEAAPFARSLVNSGRLSTPCTYDGSSLNGADDAELPLRLRPGSPALDAPVDGGWLIDRLGDRFQVLAINCAAPAVEGAEAIALTTANAPELATRYLGGADQAIYLLRPDQHVAARWISAGPDEIAAATTMAKGG